MKRKIMNCAIVIGIILFLFGVYASFFKAGLPIQDPTPEMASEWVSYNKLGDVLTPLGIAFVLIGVVFKMLIKFSKIYTKIKKK